MRPAPSLDNAFAAGVNVSELDEAWEIALAEAQRKASSAGRGDVAEYLRLRSSNDLLRKTGIEWLLSTFSKLAGQANRAGGSIQILEHDSHRFSVPNATMVGPRLDLTFGVRVLSIEAGWPRVPSDSFLRGGGIARARIKHLGKPSLTQDLSLMLAKNLPSWVALDKEGRAQDLHEADIQRHLMKLLSADYR
jgi:hypothetical protein